MKSVLTVSSKSFARLFLKPLICLQVLLFSSISLGEEGCAYYSAETSQFGIETLVAGNLYAVHSAIQQTNQNEATRIIGNSMIYVIKGNADVQGNHAVWIFGSGYGDPGVNGGTPSDVHEYLSITGQDKDAFRSADDDAEDVDCVITQSFGLTADYVKLRFISPHGHLDHVNHEFLDDLTQNYGYSLNTSNFYIHAADYPMLLCTAPCCGNTPCSGQNAFWGAPYNEAFSASVLSRFLTLGSLNETESCAQMMSFQSPMGLWQVRHEASLDHTGGVLYLRNANLAANTVTYIAGIKQQFMTCAMDGPANTNIVIYDVHRT